MYTHHPMFETNDMFIHTRQKAAAGPSVSKEIDFYCKEHTSSSANWSPFSTSPDDCSDLQYSCEDLNSAFSQASFNHSVMQPIEEQDIILEEDILDYEEKISLTNATSMSPLTEMLRDFPDLPSFVDHQDFPSFSKLLLEFKKYTLLASEPSNRPFVQSWLKSAALQIHFLMCTIAKSNSPNANPESQPRRMFTALRQLKDRIEITYQVFDIVETGRVSFGKSPSAAIAPLAEEAKRIKREVSFFSSRESKVIPVITSEDASKVHLLHPEEVTMADLSERVIDTYNLMPYHKNKFSTTAANNLIMSLPASAAAATTIGHFDTPLPTSFQPVEYNSSTTSSSYIQNGSVSSSHHSFLSNQNGSFIQPTLTTNEPMNHRVPFSHIQPSWIHCASSSSLPVTPSANQHLTQQQFLSLPTTPTRTQEVSSSVDDIDPVCTPCNTARDSSLSPYQASSQSPLNTISEHNSDYELEDEDEDMDIDIEEQDGEEDDDQDVLMTIEEDDEEYTVSDGDEEWKEAPKRRSKRTTANVVTKRKELRNSTISESSNRHYTRRTATSYDVRTTHYLKTIFFDIYSNRDKLTKDQRRQVQKETGLKPRNITYWFSNHKRRFQNSLLVFKKTVKESKGSVKTYDDFLNWRRAHGLSEEVLENEHLDII